MNFFRLLATLAARQKPFIINGSVGFTTFAVGDVLSQGARPLPPPPPPTPTAVGITPAIQQKPSWQQLIADRTRGVDFRRSVKVGLLGVVTNGFFLGAWYRVLDRYLGADRSNIQGVLKKCVADQIIYAPFSITTFVSYAAMLNGDGMRNVAQETVDNLRETFWSTWLMDCRVWPVANLVMFRLIPSSYRPSFASVVQVAWQTYLSSVSYDRPKHSAIQALSEGKPASVRGGAVKDRMGELPVPLPQVQSPAAVAHSLEHQRVTMADRRQTGRFAEGPQVSDALSTDTARRGRFRNPGKAYSGAVSLEGAEGAPRSKSKGS